MPEAQTPVAVAVVREIGTHLVALAMLGAALYLTRAGQMTGEMFAGVLAAVGAAFGVRVAVRRKRAPAAEPIDPAPPRAVRPRGDTTQTMRAVDTDRAMKGYLRVPGWYRTLLRRGLRATQHVAVGARAAWSIARALCVLAVLALAGCPLPAPDGCTPRDTRCAPDGVPEVCSSTQRWTRGQPSEPCPERSTCCRARSPYGRELHACVPPSACLPESPAPSTPSALAGSQ